MGIGFNNTEFQEDSAAFAPPVPGNYRVKVGADSKDGFSKKDKEQITLKLEILEGPMKGRNVLHYLTDGPKASLFIGLALQGLGIDSTALKVVNSKTFIGKTGVVLIENNDGGYIGVKRFLDRKFLVEDVPVAVIKEKSLPEPAAMPEFTMDDKPAF